MRSHLKNLNIKTRLFLPVVLVVMMLLPALSVTAQDLTCKQLPVLMESFHDHHYALRDTTPAIQARSVDQMINRLDPSKTLLYEADVEKLKPHLAVLFQNSRNPTCASLADVYALVVSRARENELLAKEILGPDFKPDKQVSFNTNIRQRPRPKTQADKQALLFKLIQFQVENALISGLDLDAAKARQIRRYELQTLRVVEQNPEKLITVAAEAFAVALDPHTSYLSAKNHEDLQIQMRLSLEGIGAMLQSDTGFTIIQELIPGGGADKTGMLKPKDKIIAVAQQGETAVDVIDMDLSDVVRLIRGKKGTKVTLTILRQTDKQERFAVTIVRDKIDITEQEATITYETRKANGRSYRVGIIDLPSFYGGEKGGRSSFEDVKKILAEAKRNRVDGVVLNLSRNGGGALEDAARVAGLFVGTGGIVGVRDVSGRVFVLANGSAQPTQEYGRLRIRSYPAEDADALYDGPLVVMTSRLSASASEIVAGALQDYRRAAIVGSDHTYGKGSVQSLIELPRGLGAMKVTTGLYFLPGGKSTQKIGVAADVRLPGWYALEEIGEVTQDYPLPAQSIAPFLATRGKADVFWKPVTPVMISRLAFRSGVRVASDKKFAKIVRDNEEAAQKEGIIRVEDIQKYSESEEGGNIDDTPSERRQKAKELYAPFLNESVNILIDMITFQKE